MSSGGSSIKTLIVELLLSLGLVVFFGIIGVVQVLLTILLATWPLEPSWFVLSSSASPDNTFIAENSVQGDEAAVGRVSVREPKGKIIYETIFNEPLPSLFLRWTDNKHLLALSDSRWPLPPIVKTTKEASIGVSYSTYVRYGAADASRLAKAHSDIALNPADISAAFDTESPSGPPARSCEFVLTAKDGEEFATIGFTITAVIYSCNPDIPGEPRSSHREEKEQYCGGIRSNFKVSRRIDATKDALLTSATISEMPSYNETPDGVGYRAVRGQFLGQSAPLLIEALGKDIFYIDYNLDFDRRNIRYRVPAAAISEPLTKFRSCVGTQTIWF